MKDLSLTKKLLFILLTIFGAALRLWNFSSRVTFGPEQAISLSDAADKVSHFTLLGMPYLQRVTSTSFHLFHSPIFSYSLIPLEIIFKHNPLPITYNFAFLNIFTGVLLFVLSYNALRNFYLSFLATLLYFLNPPMVHHSLFIWIINYFPLLGLLTLYFIFKLFTKPKVWHSFILGIVSGLGIGLDIAYTPLAILVFLLLLFRPKKLLNMFIFINGILFANLPTIIFDYRHQFFHLRVYYQFFLDYLHHAVGVAPDYYHFLNFYPLLFILVASLLYFLAKISRQYFLVAFLTFIIALAILFRSPFWNPNNSIGMPLGITLSTYDQAAQIISSDNPGGDYNVATLYDFDTRANPLRYLLTYVYHTPPKSVIDYPHAGALYVLGANTYNLNDPQVWELQSNFPYQVKSLHTFSTYTLSKLTPSPN